MKAGFAKIDITPRVGVELCGYGAYLNRHSTVVHDPLSARAMAMQVDDGPVTILIACDVIGIAPTTTAAVRSRLASTLGIAPANVMITCSHTHSGPAPGLYTGWGETDIPYIATLPQRLTTAAITAVERLQPARLSHAITPCTGMGYNREYDVRPSLAECLQPGWQPAKPELTDTVAHAMRIDSTDGRPLGFISYFGCHPVIGGSRNTEIHGDFAGLATNRLEAEFGDGVVGLFLQGAQGDINSCSVHHGPEESIRALDILSDRYADAIRVGLQAASPVDVQTIAGVQHQETFCVQAVERAAIESMLAEKRSHFDSLDLTDLRRQHDHDLHLDLVYIHGLETILGRADRGESQDITTELHGLRIGPISLLGSGFEIFQAIRNEAIEEMQSEIPLVVTFANTSTGYAVDRDTTVRGGYAASQVPYMLRHLPFAAIHDELVAALRRLDRALT